VASGLSGPRRPYAGAVRDLILGVRLLDGTGEDLTFGGRVMKNVAGFDVSRLTAGALGTLGLITEISLKCLPVPKSESTLAFDCSADQAIRMANEWGGQPLPLSATCYHGGRLRVRLSGAQPAVSAAMTKMGGQRATDFDEFWESVRDHRHPFFAPATKEGKALWRLSVRPTAPYTDLGGDQLIEWGGGLRWLIAGERTDASKVRAWAVREGGHATVFRAPAKDVAAFHPLDATIAALHRKLKSVFDPHGILNRGRMLADA
jgi:glycolate oxidase FAD binding subunit